MILKQSLVVFSVLELLTGIAGIALLWWQTNVWIALSVFLLIWSHNTRRSIETVKTRFLIK